MGKVDEGSVQPREVHRVQGSVQVLELFEDLGLSPDAREIPDIRGGELMAGAANVGGRRGRTSADASAHGTRSRRCSNPTPV
jgi:hypothetical protein